ncbi:hypothetical protein [Chondrinema litorale]|uniref:hypothetical protein n=1 Tax=Chondrinema litorale TaxID=2994555 RepID=UPI0025433AB6|nr:hypothetical protein [Chondrinema litorale]UZS00237.1 hypothetical protein OQ292_40565 [Chondrinema litorale]
MSKLKKIFKQQNKESHLKRAKEKFTAKTFYQKYISLFNILFVFRYLLAAFSVTTGVYFLSYVLDFVPFAVAVAISIALYGGLELIKNNLTNNTFEEYYTKGFDWVLIPTLIIFVFSVYSSLSGVKEIHSSFDKRVSFLEDEYKITLDSINAKYDTLIAAKKEETEKFVWKGRINMYEEGTSQSVQRINTELSNLSLEKNNSLGEAKVKFEEIIFIAKQNHRFKSDFWIFVSIVVELGILSCLWFLNHFDYKVSEEAEKASKAGEVETYEIDNSTFNKLFQLARFYDGKTQTFMLPSNQVQTVQQPVQTNKQSSNVQPQKIGFSTDKQRSNVQKTDSGYLEKYKTVVHFIQEGLTEKEICSTANIKRSTLYKIKAILRNQS